MPDVAGRTVAAADDVLALRLKGEVLVEGRYAVGFRLADAQALRQTREDRAGQVVVMLLDFLQNCDNRPRIVLMGGDDLIHDGVVESLIHTDPSL